MLQNTDNSQVREHQLIGEQPTWDARYVGNNLWLGLVGLLGTNARGNM